MTRLRHTLERARRHPLLGPLLLILVLLLLVVVAIHAVQSDRQATSDVGPLCLIAAAVVSILLTTCRRRPYAETHPAVPGSRRPPGPDRLRQPSPTLTAHVALPLRR